MGEKVEDLEDLMLVEDMAEHQHQNLDFLGFMELVVEEVVVVYQLLSQILDLLAVTVVPES